MPSKFAPKIVYGTGPTTITLIHPQRLWSPSMELIGGSRVSSSGTPNSFHVRTDEMCDVTLIFYQSEYAAIQAFVKYVQQNPAAGFTFWFNQLDAGTAFTVYLDSPALGERFAPVRHGNAQAHVWEFTMRIRSTNSTPLVVAVS